MILTHRNLWQGRNHYAEHTYLIDIFRCYTVITTFKEERADTDYGSHVILLRLVYLQYFLTSYLHTSYLLRYSATMIVLPLSPVQRNTMVLDIKGHSEDCKFESSARYGIFWDHLH